jgi:hypothetical protein
MIPIIVKRSKDPDAPPLRGSTYYIYAANGIFQVKRTPMYEVCAKVDHEVPGMEHQTPYMRPEFSMIPTDVMDQTLSFFRRVLADLSGEAIVELYYNTDSREWAAIPPIQGVSGTHKPPKEYGMCFEDLARIEKAQFRPDDRPYADAMGWGGGHYAGYGYTGSGGGYGATGWHSLLYQPSAEAPPEGFLKMGTIHSHMTLSAYFSATDDADDRYGDGLHLVFGHIKENTPTLTQCVAARFMSNGTPFNWEKAQLETLVDPFIDPNAEFPAWWLKRCHIVETEHQGDTEIYVSVKTKKEKRNKANNPAPWRGAFFNSRGHTPLGNHFGCGDRVEFTDHNGSTHTGHIQSVVFHRGDDISYAVKRDDGRVNGGIPQERVRSV